MAARLIAIGGMSGTGKSTLAAALAPHVGPPPGAAVLRSDVLRKRAAGLPLDAKLPPGAYTAQTRRAVYHVLCAEARRHLESGRAVIADAVWTSPEDRALVQAVADEAGTPFHGLWLLAPIEEMLRRVAGRTGDPSDATAEIVRAQAALAVPPPANWHVIPAGGDLQSVIATARAILATQ